MGSNIIDRKKIELNSSQTKMIISGWGEDVFENTIVEKITYISDGLKVKGYLAYPNNPGQYPCIIWNRGGMKENGAIDTFTARGMFGQMASWGYVIFASHYRGTAGGEGSEELGGKDVNDILNLIPLAKEVASADGSKWGIEGWSRGGMMTYLTLRRNKNFKCAVLAGAISDFMQFLIDNPQKKKDYEKIIVTNDLTDELKKRSAVYFADELPSIPYLIMHGGADKTVSPLQSIEISQKFLASNILHRLVIFEGSDHFLRTHRKEVDILKKQWYEKYLK